MTRLPIALALAPLLLVQTLTAQSELERGARRFSLGEAQPIVVPWAGPRLSLAEVELPVIDRRELDRPEPAPFGGALDAVVEQPRRPAVVTASPRGFDVLPGGIVLGRTAQPTVEPGPVELLVDGRGVALATGDRRYYLPEQRPQVLAGCIDFILRPDGSDVMIDIRPDSDGRELVRIAPELDVGPLRELLRRADSKPGAMLPGALTTKTLILDDAAGFALVGERVVPSVALEVRVLLPRDRGFELRAAHLESSYRVSADGSSIEHAGGLFIAPPPASLARELRPLPELAGLIACLRWVEQQAPGSLRDLRGRLGVPPRPAALSLTRELRSGAGR